MSFKFNQVLPTPEEIIKQFPVDEVTSKIKQENDNKIKEVLEGKSDKFLVIVGPCSADNEEAVCDYIGRLKVVADKVKDKVIVIPRIYTNKPRTTGEGYKGIVHQPDPEKEPDLLNGLIAMRKLHIHALKQFNLPIADEMLYPENYSYLADVLSYVAIGARSVENQQHRLVASGVEVPTGMKNPTSGDFSVMLNSVIAAQSGHNFIYRGYDVSTSGNPHAHVILRGAVNKHGQAIPNYHYEDLLRLLEMYSKLNLKNQAAIIDCNHSNSNKQYMEQIRITKEILNSRKHSSDIHNLVKGLMIESYIEGGCQKIGTENHVYGKSITDPCLGFDDTEKLLYEIAEKC